MRPIVLLIILCLHCSLVFAERCTSKPSCFVKGLFDFNFPKEGVYPIELTDTVDNYWLKAYGDFNSDLATDYAAIDSFGNILVYLFNLTTHMFDLGWNGTISTANSSLTPKRIYLCTNATNTDDINGDNLLDLTVWSQINPAGNVLTPFFQSQTDSFSFRQQSNNISLSATTSDPILISLQVQVGFSQFGLLLYDQLNSRRAVYVYMKRSSQYEYYKWEQFFSSAQDYSSVGFTSTQHWNTFIDLNNDCWPDVVITNAQFGIEVWIASNNLYIFDVVIPGIINQTSTSLSFSDVNANGGTDLVVTYNDKLTVFYNANGLQSEDQFCKATPFQLDLDNPKTVSMPAGTTIIPQSIKFGDMNIDSFPEVLLLLENGQQVIPFVLRNTNNVQIYSAYDQYNDAMSAWLNDNFISTTLSASFMDVLENGIVDVNIVVQASTGPIIKAFYNNYLYQNNYYLKGYGTSGSIAAKGTQSPGIVFYWINSVGSDLKVMSQTQIIQTAYDALSLPYVVNGLGRANNYVQGFTIGKNGFKRTWSPIIPNSQLAIYTGYSDSSTWSIKIFAMPTEFLVDVIIVCAVVLSLLGIALLILKWRQAKGKEHHLLLVAVNRYHDGILSCQ